MWHVVIATEPVDETGRINPDSIVTLVESEHLGQVAPLILDTVARRPDVVFVRAFKRDKRS